MKLLLPILALVFALVIAACGQPAGTSGPAASATAPAVDQSAAPSTEASIAPSAGAGDAEGTLITVKDFTLDPKDVSVTGPTVTLAVTNEGPTLHNIAIRDEAGKVLATTRDLDEGESETISAEIAPGAYVLFCSLAGHESLGIKGTLTVGN